MHEFNIPSVSPELANDDVFSGDFVIKYDLVVRNILKDNYPWIYHTFKKMAGEVQFDPLKSATFSLNGDSLYLSLDIKNIGLQDWKMKDEGLQAQYRIGKSNRFHSFNMPNIEARKSAQIEIPVDLAS